ncbi:uncharacterized protein LOC127430185 [Myxocyprinus asiaticus]|uniref:uncharacterized protein LOC127430185 n=1 Tax=Myxocyprinus asiaticus TaxID=70543 RepID=UPI0022236230|nr:uncharacterized protein LOC127430185 [Myxocyprinus asiaticus]
MTSSSNPRFRLMIGWCCLMSAALIIMTAFLATKTSCHKELNTNKTIIGYKEHSSKENDTPHADRITGSLLGQSFKDYIRLIREERSWICSHIPLCESSSLSLKDNTVEITTSGLYYIHAQVDFRKPSQANNQVMKKPGTITLVRNDQIEGAKQLRKLSEVTRYEAGSASIIRMVQLEKGDTISLDIQESSMVLSTEDSNTYWEIILLSHL